MYKLIINLKTYKESTGKSALKIAKICKEVNKVAKKNKVEIILCPQLIDIKEISKLGVKTYAQHIDILEYGANTGYTIPQALKDIGVSGTLISHSEHQLSLNDIKETVKIAKKYKLETCICARNTKRASEVKIFKPNFIAVEPKELIGGNISISTANPNLIKNSKKVVGKIPLLIGAGVKTSEDVKIGIELGAKGILVASGIVKAKNIKRELLNMIKGFDK